jgi:DNA polymerase III alpha subunit
MRQKWARNDRFHETAKESEIFCGVVTHVRRKFDRKKNEMAYFGLMGVHEAIEVICFASTWCEVSEHIRSGRLLKIKITKARDELRGGISYFFDGGTLKWLRKESATSGPAT